MIFFIFLISILLICIIIFIIALIIYIAKYIIKKDLFNCWNDISSADYINILNSNFEINNSVDIQTKIKFGIRILTNLLLNNDNINKVKLESNFSIYSPVYLNGDLMALILED